MNAARFDALLFDFDGVLADTEPRHYQCWRAIVEPLGIRVDWEYYRENCVGVPDEVLARERFRLSRPAEQVERKRAAFRAALEAAPPFLPATLELVGRLAAAYSLAVVSSSARSEVEPPLMRAGIRDCFRAMVTREDVAEPKPAAEPYRKAAALLGARRPLVIEDSEHGVASGRAAGFEVLRIATPEELAARVELRLREAGVGPGGHKRQVR